MHLACQQANVKIVSLLLRRGVSPHVENKNKKTPLHVATSMRKSEIVAMLLNSGVDPEGNKRDDIESPLIIAAQQGDTKTVQTLLKGGASPRRHTKRKSYSGWNPLHFAAHKGHLEIVQHLIDNPWTNPKSKTHAGLTAAKIAKNAQHFKIVKFIKKQTNSGGFHKRISAALMSPKFKNKVKGNKSMTYVYILSLSLFTLERLFSRCILKKIKGLTLPSEGS